jgi:Predicted ATPase of the PP-loop superfamily implicated in cell cycle control
MKKFSKGASTHSLMFFSEKIEKCNSGKLTGYFVLHPACTIFAPTGQFWDCKNVCLYVNLVVMRVCSRCILTDSYPGISFGKDGLCSICSSKQVFKPLGEESLMHLFDKAKAKKRGEYDALVPLSGGKDSMFILYLAVKVYNLKVMTMTYDNGFVSQIAKDNMARAVEMMNVKHIVCKPEEDTLRKIYKEMLINSGDICGACGIAIRANMFKVASDYKIPMILLGTSPLEEDSFLPDTTLDISRFKYILKKSAGVTKKNVNNFLIYPKMNYFRLSIGKRTGKYAKEVRPLFYIENPSDKDMGEIIKRELGWQEDTMHEYSKHFDCIAEPFTNYVRHHIYGYERRVCQYSTMIRRGEITREKALAMYTADNILKKPPVYSTILGTLDVSDNDMEKVMKIKPLKYERHVSMANKLFFLLMKLIGR